MLQEGRQLSQIVPLLVAALVCDTAVDDPSTGKKSLIGIFSTLHTFEFPTERPISFYFKLVDAEGDYEIDVRYVQVATGQVLANAKGGLKSTDRHAQLELHLPFPPVPIPEEGIYEFQIWANNVFLGSASIKAERFAQQRGG